MTRGPFHKGPGAVRGCESPGCLGSTLDSSQPVPKLLAPRSRVHPLGVPAPSPAPGGPSGSLMEEPGSAGIPSDGLTRGKEAPPPCTPEAEPGRPRAAAPPLRSS